jgi:hypothetical protein
MIMSDAWRDLKSTSIKLYVAMKLRYNGNNHDDIEFPHSEAKKIISRNVITSCFNDLILHGFIEVVREGRIARMSNIYKFSDSWQKWPDIDPKTLTPVHIGPPNIGGSATLKNGGSGDQKPFLKLFGYPQK